MVLTRGRGAGRTVGGAVGMGWVMGCGDVNQEQRVLLKNITVFKSTKKEENK